MSTTIDIENAKQIREPMQVYIHLFSGGTASISSYTAHAPYKSYDSTLGNTSYQVRNIADLAGDGFLLDGSAEWYDSSIAPSENNGKLGLRGNVGDNVQLSISASQTLTTVTIASQNVDSILVGSEIYPSTGLNVIPINGRTATITFVPIDTNNRVIIDYLIPGAEFSITNNNLVSCVLALRSNLNVENHSWEESEIEVNMYYPYNISDTFAYIQSDFPITYQAGYDDDLSELRRFYLSEPITQKDNVITIHGVDASHLLDSRTMPEQWLNLNTGNAREAIYNKFVQLIQSTGITLIHKQNVSRANSGTLRYSVLPEMTVRDFVAGVMNLTMNYKRSGTYYGIQFVDAGIPTVEFGNGKTFGNEWTLNKSDLGDWSESYEQNIAVIRNSNDERKFNETITNPGGGTRVPFWNVPYYLEHILPVGDKSQYTPTKKGQDVDVSFDGISFAFAVGINTAALTPSKCVGTVKADSYLVDNGPGSLIFRYQLKNGAYVVADPAAISGGVKSFANPNNLPGITIDFEPFIYGQLLDANGANVFNHASLFNRSLRTGSFEFKGDPRMQPLDYLNITNDTGDGRGNITARITEIELTHESGGTKAKVEWREWS